MKKTIASILFGTAVVLLSANVSAQSLSTVDPGFSSHNYKQPHKARMAKKVERQQTNSQVDMTVEPRSGNRFSDTPKYATRPATVILGATQQGKDFNLNPLQSPHHYKLHDVEVDRMLINRSRVATSINSSNNKQGDTSAE